MERPLPLNNLNRLAANCGEVPTFKTSHGRTLTEVNHSQEALNFEKVNGYLSYISFILIERAALTHG